jgi:hypothetical protein
MIEAIKAMDEDTVVLSIVRVDFNANENDIMDTYHDINFISVKKYNPGSFNLEFATHTDAIDFIRKPSRQINGRNFLIKLSSNK